MTAKLICAFVFAYADCWISHEAAQITLKCSVSKIQKSKLLKQMSKPETDLEKHFVLDYMLTKTRPCNIQRFISDTKNENFIEKKKTKQKKKKQHFLFKTLIVANEDPQSVFWIKLRKIGIHLL